MRNMQTSFGIKVTAKFEEKDSRPIIILCFLKCLTITTDPGLNVASNKAKAVTAHEGLDTALQIGKL